MVGLSILLEAHKKSSTTKVINKTITIKPSRSPSSSSSSTLHLSSTRPAVTFLDSCFLCKQRLLPGKDIYMYKGDRAFCSEECRCRHIFIDEESVRVSNREMNCSLAALKPNTSTTSSSSTSRDHNHQRKGNRNRAGGFAY